MYKFDHMISPALQTNTKSCSCVRMLSSNRVWLDVQRQRKTAENNGEENDEDTHRAALELMRHHAQQRIAVMQGGQLNIDDELEQVAVCTM